MTPGSRRGRYSVDMSLRALADMDELASKIAEDSPVNAVRFIARLKAAALSLDRMPNRGALALEGIIDGHVTRNIFVGNYRILYVVVDRMVWILRVSHIHRLPLN